MNLQQLETFHWVVALGSFTKAANKLNITQSTVSMRISDLEQDLGVRLLDRSQRAVRMTPKGRDLFGYAMEIRRLVGEMRSNVGNPQTVSGSIRMGVAELVALTWLPDLIADLNRLHPNVEIDLEIGVSGDMIDKLVSRQIDLSFLPMQSLEQAGMSRGLQATLMGNVDFAFMAAPSLALPDGRLRPGDLERWPLISFSQRSVLAEIQEGWFQANGSSPTKIDRSNSMEISAGLVRSGLGLSLLPVAYYAEDIRAGRLQILDVDPVLPPVSFFAVRAASVGSPLIDRVVDLAGNVSSFNRT